MPVVLRMALDLVLQEKQRVVEVEYAPENGQAVLTADILLGTNWRQYSSSLIVNRTLVGACYIPLNYHYGARRGVYFHEGR